MEESFIVDAADLAAAFTAREATAASADVAVVPRADLSSDHQAAVAAVWAITNTMVSDKYEVNIASSDDGGWTVVRIAAVRAE